MIFSNGSSFLFYDILTALSSEWLERAVFLMFPDQAAFASSDVTKSVAL